jgi:hypothetical protein
MKVICLWSYRVVLLLACATTAFAISGCFLLEAGGPDPGEIFRPTEGAPGP